MTEYERNKAEHKAKALARYLELDRKLYRRKPGPGGGKEQVWAKTGRKYEPDPLPVSDWVSSVPSSVTNGAAR